MKNKDKKEEQGIEEHLKDERLIKPEVSQNQNQEKISPEIESKTSQNFERQNANYLDREFGYLSTDYFLKDASETFGEWAKGMTAAGVRTMGELDGFGTTEDLQNEPEITAGQEVQQESENQLNNQPNQEEHLSNEDLLKMPLKERLEAIRNENGITPESSPEPEQENSKELNR